MSSTWPPVLVAPGHTWTVSVLHSGSLSSPCTPSHSGHILPPVHRMWRRPPAAAGRQAMGRLYWFELWNGKKPCLRGQHRWKQATRRWRRQEVVPTWLLLATYTSPPPATATWEDVFSFHSHLTFSIIHLWMDKKNRFTSGVKMRRRKCTSSRTRVCKWPCSAQIQILLMSRWHRYAWDV